jgi:DNA replication and repair protein RecF
MYLKNLKLIQFKNFQDLDLVFDQGVNCFFGVNGAGKTNLLDAIHYLCLTKSAFIPGDSNHIRHEKDFFTIKGEFDLLGKELGVNCFFEIGKKKRIEVNSKPYTKLSEHIGLLPLVIIAPDDTEIINGGSEERRKFFDSMICQADQNYLQRLIRYQQYLKQRNALLKRFAEEKRHDKSQLAPYDEQLIQLSYEIYQTRQQFLKNFLNHFNTHYADISGAKERVDIQYKSQVDNENFKLDFVNNLKKDLILKRTGFGIHKDDFIFTFDEQQIKKFGSQGQKKSFLISLKLAQFYIFKEIKGTKPLLLLDDIFDKLDDARIHHLIAAVANKEFGQLFITDARPERSREILSQITSEFRTFTISNNTINEIELNQ